MFREITVEIFNSVLSLFVPTNVLNQVNVIRFKSISFSVRGTQVEIYNWLATAPVPLKDFWYWRGAGVILDSKRLGTGIIPKSNSAGSCLSVLGQYFRQYYVCTESLCWRGNGIIPKGNSAGSCLSVLGRYFRQYYACTENLCWRGTGIIPIGNWAGSCLLVLGRYWEMYQKFVLY